MEIYRKVCPICQKEFNKEKATTDKIIKQFCPRCLREIKNGEWLAEWSKQKQERRTQLLQGNAP